MTLNPKPQLLLKHDSIGGALGTLNSSNTRSATSGFDFKNFWKPYRPLILRAHITFSALLWEASEKGTPLFGGTVHIGLGFKFRVQGLALNPKP